MAKDTKSPQLQELRRLLDEVDEGIVRLIAKRYDTVGQIIKEKAGHTQTIRDPRREREVLARVEAIAHSLGLSAPLARKIFSEIIHHSVARQAATLSGVGADGREVAIAYQGAPLTYNQLAAQKYIAGQGVAARFVATATSKEAVDQLATGAVDLTILPIENTIGGSINEVYDLLREHDVHIVGEETYKVDLCLATFADVPLTAIRRVLSHPLALAQCSAFVGGLTGARAIPTADTAEALDQVEAEKDPTVAGIGSPEGAVARGLHILRRGIGNAEEVLMRYVALARSPAPVDARVPCKTSLILTTRHEQGALLRCLQVLSDYGLSLTKLESRPRPDRAWEYMFFIDFEGNVADEKVAAAIDELRTQAVFLKTLGCYPAKATPLDPQAAAVTGSARGTASDEGTAKTPVAARRSPAGKLADRATRSADTIVRVGDLLIGGAGFTVIAGPATIGSSEAIEKTATFLREHGAHILRAGVSRPRNDAFHGIGTDGVERLVAAGRAAGLPVATEVMAPEEVRGVADKVDVLQIGARNMQNFPLLAAVGKVNRPVLLERGLSSTIDEWLAAAEYILAQGNGQVILCERGIRTFESATRNTLDLSAVVILRERTHLPVIVDPSHGTGQRSYAAPMAWAARACGAHGVLLEVNPDPDVADDGEQSLTFPELAALMDGLAKIPRLG